MTLTPATAATTTSAGRLHIQPELVSYVRGRPMLLLDDILDTGQTFMHLTEHFRHLGVASLRVAVVGARVGAK